MDEGKPGSARREAPQFVPDADPPPRGESTSEEIHVILKNSRGLKFDEDVVALLEEARCIHWDNIMVTETWRPVKEELWDTEEGHKFMGSGFAGGRRGVAIILHQRWESQRVLHKFVAVSEHICFADLQIRKLRIRAVCTYLQQLQRCTS